MFNRYNYYKWLFFFLNFWQDHILHILKLPLNLRLICHVLSSIYIYIYIYNYHFHATNETSNIKRWKIYKWSPKFESNSILVFSTWKLKSYLFMYNSIVRDWRFKPLEGVWYMYLKTENCYLKTCVKIYVNEKVCGNTYNII